MKFAFVTLVVSLPSCAYGENKGSMQTMHVKSDGDVEAVSKLMRKKGLSEHVSVPNASMLMRRKIQNIRNTTFTQARSYIEGVAEIAANAPSQPEGVEKRQSQLKIEEKDAKGCGNCTGCSFEWGCITEVPDSAHDGIESEIASTSAEFTCKHHGGKWCGAGQSAMVETSSKKAVLPESDETALLQLTGKATVGLRADSVAEVVAKENSTKESDWIVLTIIDIPFTFEETGVEVEGTAMVKETSCDGIKPGKLIDLIDLDTSCEVGSTLIVNHCLPTEPREILSVDTTCNNQGLIQAGTNGSHRFLKTRLKDRVRENVWWDYENGAQRGR